LIRKNERIEKARKSYRIKLKRGRKKIKTINKFKKSFGKSNEENENVKEKSYKIKLRRGH